MPKFRIVADKPIAYDSPDHIQPHGTAHDNSVNPRFNQKLAMWIPIKKLRVLDLGCSGGGFVKSIIDQGGLAVGVEGSDYSKVRRRAEWATIPDHLFTADATWPFQILEIDGAGREAPAKFNCITGWEFIEHIAPDRLAGVAKNILRHLATPGVVIMSVSPKEEVINGVRLHQTVANKDWWVHQFRMLGMITHDKMLSFFGNDYVRWEANAQYSFHLIMTSEDAGLPYRYRLKMIELQSRWHAILARLPSPK
jgi:SAM-dependent methyltransferase